MFKTTTHALVISLGLMVLTASTGRAQSRTMYVGNVELRLGMARATVVNLLNKYDLSVSGTSLIVMQRARRGDHYDVLRNVGFENNVLTYISRTVETSGWPEDEGFGVARAIYDALNGSIALTDSDGAKRTSATIVIDSHDADQPTRGNIRTIGIFMNGRKVSILIWDGANGKSVSASVAIRANPW